jgi:hypothetical protein
MTQSASHSACARARARVSARVQNENTKRIAALAMLIGIVVAGGRARTKEGNNKVKNTHITQKAAQNTHTPETHAPSRPAARGVAAGASPAAAAVSINHPICS